MLENKEFTEYDFTRLKVGISAVLESFRESMHRVITWLTPFAAYLQANALEEKGRLCQDKRKRNRFFRKAKRLRRDHPLGKK